MRYRITGQVQFTSNARRNQAESALATQAAERGFTGSSSRITIAGKPGLAFDYATDDQGAAFVACGDLAARLVLDEQSWWGFTADRSAA